MAMWAPPFAVKKANDPDPFPIFKFWVEIDSIIVAEFQECSGLRMERTVEMIEEGGVNDHVHILPGRNKYSNIVLKKGMVTSDALWNWYQQGLFDAKVKRVNFSILLRDVRGDVAKRWNVLQGFPVKWEGPHFTSSSNETAIETLEIAHHGLTMGN
jgi:phage tail-like protein